MVQEDWGCDYSHETSGLVFDKLDVVSYTLTNTKNGYVKMEMKSEEAGADTAYSRWYASNKGEFNAKRRKRYKEDKKYRFKAMKNASVYRKSGPENVMTRLLFREYNGQRVQVFRISTVGEKIGRSVQAIRQWEKNGIIPKPLFGAGHRVYTEKQVTLLKLVVELSDKYRHSHAEYKKNMAVLTKHIGFEWGALK